MGITTSCLAEGRLIGHASASLSIKGRGTKCEVRLQYFEAQDEPFEPEQCFS